eukprot:1692822-Rhodomonas_salina.3
MPPSPPLSPRPPLSRSNASQNPPPATHSVSNPTQSNRAAPVEAQAHACNPPSADAEPDDLACALLRSPPPRIQPLSETCSAS